MYARQEGTVRTGHGTTDWFKTGKGVCEVCMLSPCLFNSYAEYIMWNAGLDEAEAGIKIAGRNNNNLRYADGTTLMAESEEELKTLLMKVKKVSEKADLKMKIMTSGPITLWWIDRETMETVTDFIILGSKITAEDDCNSEIKRCLLLGRKAMTNLDSMLKNRDMTLWTKVCIIKAIVFPVVMYQYESWTIKKAECWRMMLLNCGVGEDSWESLGLQGIQPVNPKGNQSWIFTGRTDAKTEAPVLWPPNVKSWVIWKDPDAGKHWRQEEIGMTEDEMVGWHNLLNGHEFKQALGDHEGQGSLAWCSPWGHRESDMTEQLNNNNNQTQMLEVIKMGKLCHCRWWL